MTTQVRIIDSDSPDTTPTYSLDKSKWLITRTPDDLMISFPLPGVFGTATDFLVTDQSADEGRASLLIPALNVYNDEIRLKIIRRAGDSSFETLMMGGVDLIEFMRDGQLEAIYTHDPCLQDDGLKREVKIIVNHSNQ